MKLTSTESNNVYILCRSRVAKLLRVLNVATGVGGKAWVKKPRIRENSDTTHPAGRSFILWFVPSGSGLSLLST